MTKNAMGSCSLAYVLKITLLRGKVKTTVLEILNGSYWQTNY